MQNGDHLGEQLPALHHFHHIAQTIKQKFLCVCGHHRLLLHVMFCEELLAEERKKVYIYRQQTQSIISPDTHSKTPLAQLVESFLGLSLNTKFLKPALRFGCNTAAPSSLKGASPCS